MFCSHWFLASLVRLLRRVFNIECYMRQNSKFELIKQTTHKIIPEHDPNERVFNIPLNSDSSFYFDTQYHLFECVLWHKGASEHVI